MDEVPNFCNFTISCTPPEAQTLFAPKLAECVTANSTVLKERHHGLRVVDESANQQGKTIDTNQ